MTKVTLQVSNETNLVSVDGALSIGCLHGKKIFLDPNFTLYAKIVSIWIAGLNLKGKL